MLEPVRTSLKNRQPLVWNRVHDLPDFVYFHHGIHVQKGVACVSCHGRVDQMPLAWKEKPLTMESCPGVPPQSWNVTYVPASRCS